MTTVSPPAPPPEVSTLLPSWAAPVEHFVRPFAHATATWTGNTLHWVSEHTGLPGAVVAALGVVLAWRVARRTWYVVFELAVAFALLFAATRLGWIRW